MYKEAYLMKTRYIKTVIAVTMLIAICISGTVLAGDGWEIGIVARVNNADNRIIIGQMTGATDDADAVHDVPAFLSGEIMAYVDLDGKAYWRDIREECNTQCMKKWALIVESASEGDEVNLNWEGSDLPDGVSLVLVDLSTGSRIDMSHEKGYSYRNSGLRKFTIEAAR
jgi:hypothetical protein